jgi:aryl-alcohol dehydrogenase-like predicted oxidoreductase
MKMDASLSFLSADLLDPRQKRLGECDKETSFKILDTYYDNGGNFIDT